MCAKLHTVYKITQGCVQYEKILSLEFFTLTPLLAWLTNIRYVSEKPNTLTMVCGKMKSMLLSVWAILLSFANSLVSWNSATPLVSDNIEIRMPPSCSVIAVGLVLMPRTKTI